MSADDTEFTTYFGKPNIQYSKAGEDGSLDADSFLRASQGVADFVGFLGTAFLPVKGDISGNVAKVRNKFLSNPLALATIQNLVAADLEENDGKMGMMSVGLLWLKRGLEFMRALLVLLVEEYDAESAESSESLTRALRTAYDRTLKRHHGFAASNIFKLVVHAAPYRRTLLKAAAQGREGCEAQCVAELRHYLIANERRSAGGNGEQACGRTQPAVAADGSNSVRSLVGVFETPTSGEARASRCRRAETRRGSDDRLTVGGQTNPLDRRKSGSYNHLSPRERQHPLRLTKSELHPRHYHI